MRILVDFGVWIDRFASRETVATRGFQALLEGGYSLLVGDLILTEVLQGTRDKADFARKLAQFDMFDRLAVCDERIAVEAARNFQLLRARGVTVRKTIDTLIATRCIVDDIPLLFADRDFLPFVEHRGMRSALAGTGVH